MKKILSILLSLSFILCTPLIGVGDVVATDNENSTNVTTISSEDYEETSIVSFSLNEAINFALENNKDVHIQDINIEGAELAYKQNIRVVDNYEKMKDMPSLGIPRTYEVAPESVINKKMLDSGATERSIELARQIVYLNKDIKINEIKYNVEKAYFDLLQSQKELEIARESVELANKQYTQSQKMYELGTISNQQLLAIELGVSQAQSGVDALTMAYEMQKMNFNNTLGLPLDKDIILTDSIQYKEYEDVDIKQAINQAFENNASLKVAIENHELQKLSLEATKVRYPEITYQYKEKEIQVEKSAQSLESAKTGIEMGVRAAYLSLTTAEKQIATYELAVEKAQKALELAQVSFELGQNTANDVNQAMIDLMTAKKNLSKQIHAYNLALLDFKYSTGLGKTQIPAGY